MKFSKFFFLSIFLCSLVACSNQEDISEMEVIASDEIQTRVKEVAQRACERFSLTPYELYLCSKGSINSEASEILIAQLDPVSTNGSSCTLTFTPQSVNVLGGNYQLDIVSTPTPDWSVLPRTVEHSLRSNINISGQVTVPFGTSFEFLYDESKTYWYLATVGNAQVTGTLTADLIGPCPQRFGIPIPDVTPFISNSNFPKYSFTCSPAC